jgi:hypothetical protein
MPVGIFQQSGYIKPDGFVSANIGNNSQDIEEIS